jgi:hypothetical protein
MLTVLVVLGLIAAGVGVWRYRRSTVKLVERYMTGDMATAPAAASSPASQPVPNPVSPVASRVRDLLAAKMPGVNASRLDQLDPLALTEFIWDIEKEFKIKMPAQAVAECRTFHELVAAVGEQVHRPKSNS